MQSVSFVQAKTRIECKPIKPASGKVHEKLTNQLAFAGYNRQIPVGMAGSRRPAADRRPSCIAISALRRLSNAIEADVPIDDMRQRMLRHILFDNSFPS